MDSLVELSYRTKFTKGINIMDQLNSTTFTPDRERGQHLKFEDRCSIRIFTKLGYSLRKTAEAIGCSASTVLNEIRRGTGYSTPAELFEEFLDQVYSVIKDQVA